MKRLTMTIFAAQSWGRTIIGLRMTRTTTVRIAATCASIVAVTWSVLMAGESERSENTYPDPGFTLMGSFRDADPAFFDYAVGVTVNWSGDDFPNKKQWWQEYRQNYLNNPLHKYTIFSGYFGVGHATNREPGLTADKVRARLDAFLAPEPGIETYPELLHGFCISEENTPHKNADLMDAAARHGIEKYGIPVWQWVSPPGAPNPAVAASGWVYDSYAVEYEWFRKLTMKYVSMGKPVHCMVWASDPSWYHEYPNGQALIEDTNEELRVLREFNVPVSVFAVAQPGGSVGTWKGKDNADMAAIRQWIKDVRRDLHTAAPHTRKPMDAANHSQGRSIEAGRPEPIPTVYEESFERFQWIDDATLSGFLDMKLTSEPAARPGQLLAKTHADRAVDVALIYEFKSDHPLTRITMDLASAAPGTTGSRNEIACSLDETTWPLSAKQAGNNGIETLSLTADARFLKGADTVYVRVRMQNEAGTESGSANRLDHLRVRCANAGVALWWNDWGTSEQQGDWARFCRRSPDGDIDGDGFGGRVHLEGTGMTHWGVQRIDAPEGRRMHDLVIDWGKVEAYKDRGGFWIIQASNTGKFDGEQIEARHDAGWGRLLLDLRGNDAFEGIGTFYIKLMGSNQATSQSSSAGPITVIGTLKPQ